ncbi:hypothetical protein [Streptomyces spectabilis]|uniref:TraR/DksA family transcriptional regulator n=1 Tax=Streptomyces spectabilis TaxID=68270 RepID=A0A516RIR9_STRST|nr:hypothetical protein [Streptomyces spectabilis]QDQ15562.1 hypothetical protein FH965_37565 [Streptomyces spectabilis]
MAGDTPTSDDVLEPLKRHLRDLPYAFDVGPGRRQLVLACHRAVVEEFPEYELMAVKQKWGALAFQAFPRPWKPGGNWTHAEYARLSAVTDVFTTRSEGICERCGANGSLRESRRIHLVLCDRCEALVPEHGRL